MQEDCSTDPSIHFNSISPTHKRIIRSVVLPNYFMVGMATAASEWLTSD